ncbi:MAG: diguanylate cyclase [Alphaproteobacteria bacterium]
MTTDLEAEHEALLQFLYLCPVGIVQIDLHGVIELANPAATRLLMPITPNGQLVNLFDVLSNVMPEIRSLSDAMDRKRGVVCQGREIDLGQVVGEKKRACWISLSVIRIAQKRQMAILHDITELVQEREAHLWKSAYLDTIFRSVKDYAIFTLDRTGHVEGWNDSVKHLLNLEAEETVGRPFDQFWDAEVGKTMSADTLLQIAQQSGSASASGWQQRKDGSNYWADCIISALTVKDEPRQSYTVIMRDMTQWKTNEDRLIQLATTDFLTGLTNRRSFLQKVDEALKERAGTDAPSTLAVMDIDNLRQINDTLGHKKGDEVIKAVAHVILRETGSVGVAGRLGGEEFAIMFPGQTIEAIQATMQRIQEAASAVDPSLDVSLSIGMADTQAGGSAEDTLFQRAEIAMSRAKAQGQRQVVAFDPGIDDPTVASSVA